MSATKKKKKTWALEHFLEVILALLLLSIVSTEPLYLE